VFDQFLEDFKADAFVEFARSNLALEENKITGFLSSELARADRGEIPVGLNNWSVSSDFFPVTMTILITWLEMSQFF
jgi:hypothetical protein